MRTHFCGLIDEALIGEAVTLCGWADVARDLGGLCFIDLRDHEGIVQVVAEPDAGTEGNAEVIATARRSGTRTACASRGGAQAPVGESEDPDGQVEVVATRSKY